MRKLARIEKIDAVTTIPDADAIDAVHIGGWRVVVKKEENFQPGDLCVYMEIDSALPLTDPRFSFLRPRGERTLPDGTVVHRLKSARLRGVVSQGLVLPLRDFPELEGVPIGTDVSEILGITKYEPPVPAELSGQVRGVFPEWFIPKTDAERVQNLAPVWDEVLAAGPWVATEKIDGTSLTVIHLTDDTGQPDFWVCSRNLALQDGSNVYWRAARESGILDNLPAGFGIQAEIFGPGIQKNTLKTNTLRVAVFAVFKEHEYIPRAQWPDWAKALAAPVLESLELPPSIEETVQQADKLRSTITPAVLAEGIVWHTLKGNSVDCLGGRDCFKAINNSWLLKYDD